MKILTATLTALFLSSLMAFAPEDNPGPGTEQGQKPLFTFGVVADVQYCDCEPAGTRYYRESLTKLRAAVGEFKADSVGFIINLGDLIDHNHESYKPVLQILDSSGIKVYHALGNHDYSVEARFKRRLPVPMPSREDYYSFSEGKFRLIVLNGNELSTYSSKSKSDIKDAVDYIAALKNENSPNAVDWHGGIGLKQLTWLRQQLNDATSTEKKVIIFCHFPIFPENEHNLLNYKEMISILEDYNNVIAWFSGHNHSGNYGNFNYIHCVNLKGMVETESTGSWSLVEVYSNKLWIKGSGRERSQILAY